MGQYEKRGRKAEKHRVWGAVTMATTKADLDAAAEVWLDAQAGFKNYLDATEALFRVFAEGWCDLRRALKEAFDDYCEALLLDSGYKHLEVAEVYPHRRPTAER